MRSVCRVTVALTLAAGSMLVTGTVAEAKQVTAPCTSTASACVDLSAKRAWLMSNGQVTFGPTAITSGKRTARTPTGRFTVLWKDKNHRSSQFNNAPMPYSVFFTKSGIAFHEGSLRRESAGCIHLGHNAAVTFFSQLAVGQEVQVVN